MQIYFISDRARILTPFHTYSIQSMHNLYTTDTPSASSSVLLMLSSDLNRLVMDYLVIEGYKEAAENFARESGMLSSSSSSSSLPGMTLDFESIQNRMNIRNAIQSGDIVGAIERVNDFDPEVSFFSSLHPLPSGHPTQTYLSNNTKLLLQKHL